MTPREFAIQVVQKLQAANYQALWAGGCVRDQLLKRTPKDYDVATNARPEQIRQLFGHKRTMPIGAAFGVITVLGPRPAGQIEVATFRRDGNYSDGRRPDAVEFTNAREDALRRDFTINGIFYDPVADQVIDYVDGQGDLRRKRIRAIGDPHRRISEDKLRMLRGVRFAATFEFELDPFTLAAITEHATELSLVSPERIGAELVRMLTDPNRAAAAALLMESELLAEVLPDDWPPPSQFPADIWNQRLDELRRLKSKEFTSAAFVWLRSYFELAETGVVASQLQSCWRLTNQQRAQLDWIAQHWLALLDAQSKPWSEIQPLLVNENIRPALDVATTLAGSSAKVEFCRQCLTWPVEKLDPAPLLNGKDLIEMGFQAGPQFKSLLQTLRDRQLDGDIDSRAAAKAFVLQNS
jgi:tRNA nucleotidyltransferase/poly(A) polymerase